MDTTRTSARTLSQQGEPRRPSTLTKDSLPSSAEPLGPWSFKSPGEVTDSNADLEEVDPLRQDSPQFLSWVNLSPDNSGRIVWSAAQEKVLMAPVDYLDSARGSGIRERMMSAFNRWLVVPKDKLRRITRVVSMLQTASLILDDVEDNSKLRRGVPVAHSIFGTPQVINAANYACMLALQEVHRLENPEAMNIYIEELLNLHLGQGMDIFWRETLTCPTEEEYIQAARGKTGGLMRLAAKLMVAESTNKTFKQCVPFADLIGIIYQVYNDYVNLKSKSYIETKGQPGDDLTEGKFSLPVIHFMGTSPDNMTLLQVLKLKTEDNDIKSYAIECLEKAGSITYTHNILMRLIGKAKEIINEIDSSNDSGLGAILAKLVENAS
ncbi:isoprenoid synthase domain-containing protein [Xylogone sp. PMI_703]|nr:isoprenoid synthase domain-containing protein [Xylogone sp. PMI_703]